LQECVEDVSKEGLKRKRKKRKKECWKGLRSRTGGRTENLKRRKGRGEEVGPRKPGERSRLMWVRGPHRGNCGKGKGARRKVTQCVL